MGGLLCSSHAVRSNTVFVDFLGCMLLLCISATSTGWYPFFFFDRVSSTRFFSLMMRK